MNGRHDSNGTASTAITTIAGQANSLQGHTCALCGASDTVDVMKNVYVDMRAIRVIPERGYPEEIQRAIRCQVCLIGYLGSIYELTDTLIAWISIRRELEVLYIYEQYLGNVALLNGAECTLVLVGTRQVRIPEPYVFGGERKCTIPHLELEDGIICTGQGNVLLALNAGTALLAVGKNVATPENEVLR